MHEFYTDPGTIIILLRSNTCCLNGVSLLKANTLYHHIHKQPSYIPKLIQQGQSFGPNRNRIRKSYEIKHRAEGPTNRVLQLNCRYLPGQSKCQSHPSIRQGLQRASCQRALRVALRRQPHLLGKIGKVDPRKIRVIEPNEKHRYSP